jgi:hypothetical protein
MDARTGTVSSEAVLKDASLQLIRLIIYRREQRSEARSRK